MKARLGLLLTTILSCFILYSCMSQEQQEQVLQNSEPQSVDVTVNVGGDSRAERFLGTFDQISRLSLDIDRNYGNKRVLTDFPLEHDGSKWTGTINKLIVGFDYTITGHAFKGLGESAVSSELLSLGSTPDDCPESRRLTQEQCYSSAVYAAKEAGHTQSYPNENLVVSHIPPRGCTMNIVGWRPHWGTGGINTQYAMGYQPVCKLTEEDTLVYYNYS